MILDPDVCMYDAYIIDPESGFLIQVAMMHICMMHLSMMLDPDTCMYDAYIYVPRSLILIHACMMHKAMILALDPEACMYA